MYPLISQVKVQIICSTSGLDQEDDKDTMNYLQYNNSYEWRHNNCI
ncbi:MAG: hypothetical protein ACI952_000797 [Flavobacteriales bacterium]|jgi:hypothetical protein